MSSLSRLCSDAEDAVHDLDGKSMMGERLRVELARSRDWGRRRGTAPGPRTNYRLLIENIASRTSWQAS